LMFVFEDRGGEGRVAGRGVGWIDFEGFYHQPYNNSNSNDDEGDDDDNNDNNNDDDDNKDAGGRQTTPRELTHSHALCPGERRRQVALPRACVDRFVDEPMLLRSVPFAPPAGNAHANILRDNGVFGCDAKQQHAGTQVHELSGSGRERSDEATERVKGGRWEGARASTGRPNSTLDATAKRAGRLSRAPPLPLRSHSAPTPLPLHSHS
jgi:hypothetical protein